MQFICLVDEVTVWWIMYAVESGIEFGLYESVLLVFFLLLNTYELWMLHFAVREIRRIMKGI